MHSTQRNSYLIQRRNKDADEHNRNENSCRSHSAEGISVGSCTSCKFRSEQVSQRSTKEEVAGKRREHRERSGVNIPMYHTTTPTIRPTKLPSKRMTRLRNFESNLIISVGRGKQYLNI